MAAEHLGKIEMAGGITRKTLNARRCGRLCCRKLSFPEQKPYKLTDAMGVAGPKLQYAMPCLRRFINPFRCFQKVSEPTIKVRIIGLSSYQIV